MPLVVPPIPTESDFNDPVWIQFFEIVRRQINSPPFAISTTDPGTSGVPNGTWGMWKNTTSGIIKLWVNDGGVMKSVTLT